MKKILILLSCLSTTSVFSQKYYEKYIDANTSELTIIVENNVDSVDIVDITNISDGVLIDSRMTPIDKLEYVDGFFYTHLIVHKKQLHYRMNIELVLYKNNKYKFKKINVYGGNKFIL